MTKSEIIAFLMFGTSLYSQKNSAMKEVANHMKHLEVTFDRLLSLLFTPKELDAIESAVDIGPKLLERKSAWIRTRDLVVDGISTECMAITHLLWFQSIGRIIIEDIDPFFGIVRLHICLQDILLAENIRKELLRRS